LYFIDWGDYDPNWVFKRPPHHSVVGNKHPMENSTVYKSTIEKDASLKKI
jgi:hypothetical protein